MIALQALVMNLEKRLRPLYAFLWMRLVIIQRHLTKSSTPTAAAKPNINKRKEKQNHTSDEDDLASLFVPKEDDESFEDMLNRSKLDPKFLK